MSRETAKKLMYFVMLGSSAAAGFSFPWTDFWRALTKPPAVVEGRSPFRVYDVEPGVRCFENRGSGAFSCVSTCPE